MREGHLSGLWAICVGAGLISGASCGAQSDANAPLPEPRQLIQDVMAHQAKVESVRENYTYSSAQTVNDIDASGKVTKTETSENEDFFVNGHVIERTVKKNGQPLNDHDEKKETERVTKLVEKAEKTPSGQPLEGQTVSVTRILGIMDVGPPRRVTYRGRPTIVFDFVGRRDAKTHGLAEDASKKLKGTIWIDEADREVAHLEAMFDDNLRVGGGLLANVQKGSSFRFDQAPVDGGLWLPTGAEGTVQAKLLLVKTMREHFVERDYDYKRFKVDAQQTKSASVVTK
ncbi:MAG TPA: hypothetical protein VKB38_22495 [Terracidiphilus sp.]|nr:hypothetical protein [Terracidiphilus sp.]